jgi:YD repeat-containing protein
MSARIDAMVQLLTGSCGISASSFYGMRLCAVAMLFHALYSSTANASALYTYDQVGRLTTAAYDNGLCISYSYDANGNRTALVAASTTPGTPTWGTGTLGCFNWTP